MHWRNYFVKCTKTALTRSTSFIVNCIKCNLAAHYSQPAGGEELKCTARRRDGNNEGKGNPHTRWSFWKSAPVSRMYQKTRWTDTCSLYVFRQYLLPWKPDLLILQALFITMNLLLYIKASLMWFKLMSSVILHNKSHMCILLDWAYMALLYNMLSFVFSIFIWHLFSQICPIFLSRFHTVYMFIMSPPTGWLTYLQNWQQFLLNGVVGRSVVISS